MYSLLDILVAIYIGKIFGVNSESNNIEKFESNQNIEYKLNNQKRDIYMFSDWIELIYLFNPLTLISCVGLQLRIIYNFFLFSLIFNLDIYNEYDRVNSFIWSVATNFYLIINLISCPANAFILIFYYLRIFYLSSFTKKIGIFIYLLISLSLTIVFLYAAFDIREFNGILTQYRNYFFVKDSLPNIGLMWGLFPEVKF